jgi:adenylate cyclase
MQRLAFLLNPAWRGVWTGLVCALLVWYCTSLPTVRGLENWMLDSLFLWRGTRPTTSRVVIIAFDEESYRRLERLGKNTAYLSPELAQIVRHVHAQGARAIGVDLFIPEGMSDLPDIEKPGAPGDARPMGNAVRDAGNVVLPRWRLDDPQKGEAWLRPLRQWQVKALDPELGNETDLASVSIVEDDDQFARKVQLLAGDGDDTIVHFSLALYLVAHKEPLKTDGPVPLVAGQPVPIEGDGLMRINYVGPPGSFPTIPFHKALEAARTGQPLPELKGAVVVIGATAKLFQDNHATPYSNLNGQYLPGKHYSRMSGTEVMANALATLEDRAYIRTPWWMSTLPTLLVLGVLLGYAFARASLAGGLGLAVMHHFGWKLLALVAFTYGNYRLPVVGMMMLGVVLYALTFALRWRLVRRLLELFKSRPIARELEQRPTYGARALQDREVTVLFADIRGFTPFSDGRNPREVAGLLMAYFDVVVPIVERHGGAVNQYMGDGMMVLFGAIEHQDDHALRAVRAAVEMVQQVNVNRREWRERGLPGMRIGVGINTGVTVVGSVGSRHRLDFTAIGETTNIAARIEALNKELQTEILISEQTWQELPPAEAARLGCEAMGREMTLRGKKSPLRVHAVIVAKASDSAPPATSVRIN